MARTKRIDPPVRSADGRTPNDQVINADPDCHYAYANPNDEATGVAYYEARGYEPVIASKDGPRSALGRKAKEGQVITVLGQVLMSRSLVEHEQEVAAGQGMADAVDRRILRDGNLDRESTGRNVAVGVDRSVSSEPYAELE